MQVVIEKAQVNKIVTFKVTVFTNKNAAVFFVKKHNLHRPLCGLCT